MTKALTAVIKFAFEKMGIHRLEAVTILDNKASVAVLNKLGFHYEGRLKNYRRYQNKSHDIDIFSLTPTMLAEQRQEQEKEAFVIIPSGAQAAESR